MSFEEFYKNNYIKLYKIALLTLHDEEESRDLVAETFKKLWQVWDDAKEPLPLAQTILRNKCISHIRHKDVKERFRQKVLSDKDFTPDFDIVHKRRIELLCKLIETLAYDEKLIIQTVIFEKRSFKDVASLLNCSYATARRKFATLLLVLKERLLESESK